MIRVDPICFKKNVDLRMTTGWKKAGMSWRKDARWESLSKKYGKNWNHIKKKTDKGFFLIQKIITNKNKN